MATLVLGIGNTLRGDDGVAAHVLELLEAQGCGFQLMATLSLVPELASDIAQNDRVIFVDADVGVREVTLQRLDERQRDALHRYAPASVVSFARTIGFQGDAWVCRVPVQSMETEVALSALAIDSAQEAARMLGALREAAPRR